MAKPPRPTTRAEREAQRKGGIHTLSGDLRAPFRDLPELEGTPRQVEWANDLRKKFFDSVEETVLPVYAENVAGELVPVGYGSKEKAMLGLSAKEIKAQINERAEHIAKRNAKRDAKFDEAAFKAREVDYRLKEYEKVYQSYKSAVDFINGEGLRKQTSAAFWINNRDALDRRGGALRAAAQSAAGRHLVKKAGADGSTFYFQRMDDGQLEHLGIKQKNGVWINAGSFAAKDWLKKALSGKS